MAAHAVAGAGDRDGEAFGLRAGEEGRKLSLGITGVRAQYFENEDLLFYVPEAYDRFGASLAVGDFSNDGRLDVVQPADIAAKAASLARCGARHGAQLWEPYQLFPAPGGLLEWAGSEYAESFHKMRALVRAIEVAESIEIAEAGQ